MNYSYDRVFYINTDTGKILDIRDYVFIFNFIYRRLNL
ncbi:Uncharacterised protein [Porphyromonas macacae]|uniref:Uncharacterized protein n=1 Tax=Porphyromonas macacae TaxID=28115 RepID=A0A379DJ73_9PORP|nr:Uncharacterised protein [Porphyromonas macacae]